MNNADRCSSVCIIEPEKPEPEKIELKKFEPEKSEYFAYEPDRPLEFNDVDPYDEGAQIILALKNIKIIKGGDYIVNGRGNPATEKQQTGIRRFSPNDYVNRLDVTKSSLIASYIPIANKIIVPKDGFAFKDLPVDLRPSDGSKYFVAKVFYTAYAHGIIKQGPDHLARPFDNATNAEIVTIGARAIKVLTPKDEAAQDFWYQKSMKFAINNGILEGITTSPTANISRKNFAKIIVRLMLNNPNDAVSGYIQQFDFAKRPIKITKSESEEGLSENREIARIQMQVSDKVRRFAVEQAYDPEVRGIMAKAINERYSEMISKVILWTFIHNEMINPKGIYYSEAYVRHYKERFGKYPEQINYISR